MTPKNTPSQTNSLDFAIQTLSREDGSQTYSLWVEHRDGRGQWSDMQMTFLTEQGGPANEPTGFVLQAKAQDGQIERIGSLSEPIPIELYRQGESSGLTAVYYASDAQGAMAIKGGEVLWFEPLESLQALMPDAAPKQRMR